MERGVTSMEMRGKDSGFDSPRLTTWFSGHVAGPNMSSDFISIFNPLVPFHGV